MAGVRLRKTGPNRVFIHGILFERGVTRDDVPPDIARLLIKDKRFKVELAAEAPKAKEVSQEGKGDLKGRPDTLQGRIAAIKEAIADLDIDDEDNYTTDGKPDARVLTQMLGWQVTSDERDQAIKPQDPKADTPSAGRGKITLTRRARTAQVEEPLDTGAERAAANDGMIVDDDAADDDAADADDDDDDGVDLE